MDSRLQPMDKERLICAVQTSFQTMDAKESVPAILTLTEKHLDEQKRLSFSVADGKGIVMHGMFSEEEVTKNLRVPLPPDTNDTFSFIHSFIDPNNEGMTDQRSFSLTQTSKESMKLECLERMPSGLVRHAWTSDMVAAKEATSEPVTLTFMLHLIHSIDQVMSQHRDSRRHIESLTQGLNEWKDTALKISGAWNREKTTLLQNFLKLYNMRKNYIKDLEQQADELKRRIEELHESLQHNLSSKVVGTKLPNFLQEQPEDQDEVMFDPETVALLAAGPTTKVRKSIAESKTKRKRAKSWSPSERGQRKDNDARSDTATVKSNTTVNATPESNDGLRKPDLSSHSSAETPQQSKNAIDKHAPPVLRREINSASSSDHDKQDAGTTEPIDSDSIAMSQKILSHHNDKRVSRGIEQKLQSRGRKPKMFQHSDSDSDDSFFKKLKRGGSRDIQQKHKISQKGTESDRVGEHEGVNLEGNEDNFIDGGMRDDILAQLEALNSTSKDKT